MEDRYIFETLSRLGFDVEQVECALDTANNDIVQAYKVLTGDSPKWSTLEHLRDLSSA